MSDTVISQSNMAASQATGALALTEQQLEEEYGVKLSSAANKAHPVLKVRPFRRESWPSSRPRPPQSAAEQLLRLRTTISNPFLGPASPPLR